MTDLAAVGLSLDTSDFTRGEAVVVASSANMERAIGRVQGVAGGTGPVFAAVAQQTQLAQQAAQQYAKVQQATAQQVGYLQKALERQGLTVDQVAAAMRHIDASLVVLPPRLQQSAQATETAASAAARGAVHFGRLGQSLTSFATQAAGVPPIVGHIAYALGAFEVGGATTVGVIGGLAVLAVAYKALTSESLKVAEETQHASDAMDRQITSATEAARAVELLIKKQAEARAFAQTGPLTAAPGLKGWFLGIIPNTFKSDATVQREKQNAVEQATLELLTAAEIRTKKYAESVSGLVSSLVSLSSAHLLNGANAKILTLALQQQDVLIKSNQGNLAVLIPALLARNAAEEALKQPLYDRLALEAVDLKQAKDRANATALFTVAIHDSMGAMEQLRTSQKQESDATALAQALWAAWAKTTGDTTLQHMNLEQAMAAGNATAKAYYATALQQTELETHQSEVLKVLTDWETKHAAAIVITDVNTRKYIDGLKDQFAWQQKILGQATERVMNVSPGTLVPFTANASAFGYNVKPKTPAELAADAKVIEQEYQRLKQLVGRELEDALVTTFSHGSAALATFVRDLAQGVDGIVRMISEAKRLGLTFELGKGFSGPGKFGANLGAGASIGQFIGGASGSAGFGLVGGAAAGFAVGGPVGAIAGAVTGFVSGLLTSSAQAKEAQRQMAEALKAFNLNLADFAAIASPRGVLGDALAQLTKQFEELATQAAAAHGATVTPGAAPPTDLTVAELQKLLDTLQGGSGFVGAAQRGLRAYYEDLLKARQAYEDNGKAITDQIHALEVYAIQDLRVRELRAKGLTAEADLEEFNKKQMQEQIAINRDYGAATDAASKALYLLLQAQLDLTQAEDRAAFQRQQAAAAIRKANADRQIEFSLVQREAAARKTPVNVAGGIALEGGAAGITALGQQLLDGTLAAKDYADALRPLSDALAAQTGLSADQLKLVHDYLNGLAEANAQFVEGKLSADQLARTLAVLGQEMGTALDALLLYNIQLQKSLGIQKLQLEATISGSLADQQAFEDAQRHAEQEQVMREALASGADESNIALLTLVQALQETAVAADRQRQAEQRLREEKQASEDLSVRLLAARGQQGAADELAFRQGQAREREQAVLDQRSQTYLNQLATTQAAELAKFLKDHAAVQQTVTAASSRSVYAEANTGVLERLDSYQATANLYLRGIEYNTAALRQGGFQYGSAGAISGNGTINVNMSLRVTGNTPIDRESAAVVAEQLAPQLDRLLNRRTSMQRGSTAVFKPL
jgi:hypothetical protein